VERFRERNPFPEWVIERATPPTIIPQKPLCFVFGVKTLDPRMRAFYRLLIADREISQSDIDRQIPLAFLPQKPSPPECITALGNVLFSQERLDQDWLEFFDAVYRYGPGQ
jgi:hypothetical protein